MGGIATSDLAVAVSKSGGLGQIGFCGNVYGMQIEMEQAKQALKDIKETDTLPIGI